MVLADTAWCRFSNQHIVNVWQTSDGSHSYKKKLRTVWQSLRLFILQVSKNISRLSIMELFSSFFSFTVDLAYTLSVIYWVKMYFLVFSSDSTDPASLVHGCWNAVICALDVFVCFVLPLRCVNFYLQMATYSDSTILYYSLNCLHLQIL